MTLLLFSGRLAQADADGMLMTGTVMSKSGTPLPAVQIDVGGGSKTESGHDGRFRFRLVGEETRLLLRHPDYRERSVHVRADRPEPLERIVMYDRLASPRMRTTTSQPPGLARLYTLPEFGGDETVIRDEGTYTREALPAVDTVQSLRLAPGYRVWIYCADPGHPDPEEPYAVKPEDDSDLTDDHRVVGFIRKIRVERAPDRPFVRPRVFMALHGNQVLTREENADQWTYVRRHLDGVWFNAAGLNGEMMASIFRKLDTRVVIKEVDANGEKAKQAAWEAPGTIWDSRLQEMHPDIHLIREALCVYHDPAFCYDREIPDLRAFYVTNPEANPAYLYSDVYTLWQPFWVGPEPYIEDREVLWGGVGERVFWEGGGVGVECHPGLFAHNIAGHGAAVRHALKRTHERPGRPFIWFVQVTMVEPDEPSPRWFQMLRNGYYLLEAEGVMQPHDIIMLINYGGKMQILPEVDPETGAVPATLMGAFCWLLHQ
jgi:hypothetical protein